MNSFHIKKESIEPKIVILKNSEGKYEWRLFFGWTKQATARSPRTYDEAHRCRTREKQFAKKIPIDVKIIDNVPDGRKRNVEA